MYKGRLCIDPWAYTRMVDRYLNHKQASCVIYRKEMGRVHLRKLRLQQIRRKVSRTAPAYFGCLGTDTRGSLLEVAVHLLSVINTSPIRIYPVITCNTRKSNSLLFYKEKSSYIIETKLLSNNYEEYLTVIHRSEGE